MRWWLLRDVNPSDDTDFRLSRLGERHDQDLANGLGNLLKRIAGLVRRSGRQRLVHTDRLLETSPQWLPLDSVLKRVDAAVESLDFRTATSALWELVAACNSRISDTRPWELVADTQRHQDLNRILVELLQTCLVIGHYLQPFLPEASHRVLDVCAAIESGHAHHNLFPRISTATEIDDKTTTKSTDDTAEVSS